MRFPHHFLPAFCYRFYLPQFAVLPSFLPPAPPLGSHCRSFAPRFTTARCISAFSAPYWFWFTAAWLHVLPVLVLPPAFLAPRHLRASRLACRFSCLPAASVAVLAPFCYACTAFTVLRTGLLHITRRVCVFLVLVPARRFCTVRFGLLHPLCHRSGLPLRFYLRSAVSCVYLHSATLLYLSCWIFVFVHRYSRTWVAGLVPDHVLWFCHLPARLHYAYVSPGFVSHFHFLPASFHLVLRHTCLLYATKFLCSAVSAATRSVCLVLPLPHRRSAPAAVSAPCHCVDYRCTFSMPWFTAAFCCLTLSGRCMVLSGSFWFLALLRLPLKKRPPPHAAAPHALLPAPWLVLCSTYHSRCDNTGSLYRAITLPLYADIYLWFWFALPAYNLLLVQRHNTAVWFYTYGYRILHNTWFITPPRS